MLTDTKIRSAPIQSTPYKLYDSGGLFLLVNPNQSRWWRFRYRYQGKEKQLALGVYPAVDIIMARQGRDAAKQQLDKGIDPSAIRKADKAAATLQELDKFQVIGDEWIVKQTKKWSSNTLSKARWIMDNHVYPSLGHIPVRQITPMVLLDCLRKIENQGLLDTAQRAKHRCGQVLRYAAVTGRCDQDVSALLKGALETPRTHHYAAITEPRALMGLLRAIDSCQCSPSILAALKLAPMLFVRPGELRQAEWADIDLAKGLWVVPKEVMKTVDGVRKPHIVPLSTQARDILVDLKAETGCYTHVFPNGRGCAFPMSAGALTRALERSGYPGTVHTVHGFRATARTILEEVLRVDPRYIEMQLAHTVKDSNGTAYNRTAFLDDRKVMMQNWSDYLDQLRIG